ncbi:hypothetical protein B0H17DRAFT_1052192 [Mycena rosella]|uniref:Hydrophobin n=1 Tax=Mycena rosella TaxID=1033263 RepID=A0AAD7GJ51_MYCRO|nr:hypothetical protein B0H17DRAFT_1052192 [Mycena rosella]
MFSKISVVPPPSHYFRSLTNLCAAVDPCCRHPHHHAPVTPPTSNQCCSSVQSSSSSSVAAVAALLGLDLSGLDIPVGLGCSPITVIGNNCGGTSVTCDAPEQAWGSLIAINCIPITL